MTPPLRPRGLWVLVAALTFALLWPVAYVVLRASEYVGIDSGSGVNWGDAALLAFIGLASSWGAGLGTRLRKRYRPRGRSSSR